MNQNYVCQKIIHLLNRNPIVINIIQNRECFHLGRKYSCLSCCNFKYYIGSAGHNSTLVQHCKVKYNYPSYFEINTTCQCLSKTTKAEEGKDRKKYLNTIRDLNIVEKYQKLKNRLSLKNNLSVWGVAGAAAYLISHELGNIAYGIATIPVAIFHLDTLKVLCSTFKRDVVFTHRYVRARLALAVKDKTLGECFDTVAQSNINEVMMFFEDTRWTYKQVKCKLKTTRGILANKITNYFSFLNYEKGDVIALMVTNRPEYIMLLIGLSKIGVIVSLINTNLRENALLHSINISKCKGIIVSEDMLKEFESIKGQINPNIEIFQLGGKVSKNRNYTNLSNALMATSDQEPEIIHKICENDPLMYIHNSNGTSLPKAAVLSHSKFIMNSVGITHLLNLGRHDIIYAPLPLYHSIAIIAGSGPAMICGIPVVIRRKFSAVRYWMDCTKYKCTVGQYVGDICRYLYLQPPSNYDQTHHVKKMVGSGLNKAIWNDFVKRFNVQITELYGAAEGNFNMINIDGKAGAVAFVPSFLPKFLHPVSIIKVDPYTLEPIRDVDGLCQRSKGSLMNPYDETGMLIGMFKSPLDLTNYNIGTSNSRIIQNVFKKGDRAYITGDMMIMDKLGYIYFMDKIEDSYHWKGETVLTKEVESIIEYLTDYTKCALYGVSIPGTNEKAGMVAIVDPDNKIIPQEFAQEIRNHLPYFACPVFMRILKDASLFKTKRRYYAEEGFNPEKITDKLYYINRKSGIYEPLTIYIYRNIVNKKVIL